MESTTEHKHYPRTSAWRAIQKQAPGARGLLAGEWVLYSFCLPGAASSMYLIATPGATQSGIINPTR